jgi:RNA polymerase sigma-70 factor (ECF subfamily)
MTDGLQEVLLIARAQVGDTEAFAQLLSQLYPVLLRYVTGMVGRDQSEDVLQETFLQIHRKLGLLTDPAAFRAWAYRIATRQAIARLKREQRWREQIRDEEVLANLPAPMADESNYLLTALERLSADISPASRVVLLLHYREELSLEHIAAILGIPLGTVKSRLAYGLSSLRELLNQKGLNV